ncbi:MAG: BON domain-containing protein [Nitrospiraceae bacterium]|mgnify:CR=1 FL=1|nr:BON domain-containing protein [Nitrospiraceae bacterium]
MPTRSINLLCLFLLLTLLQSCGLRSVQTGSDLRNDSTISTDVEAKLKADRLEDLSEILVSTEAGTVTLVGSVQTPQQKARAAELARQVKGVKRVKNDVEIRGHFIEDSR